MMSHGTGRIPIQTTYLADGILIVPDLTIGGTYWRMAPDMGAFYSTATQNTAWIKISSGPTPTNPAKTHTRPKRSPILRLILMIPYLPQAVETLRSKHGNNHQK